MLDLSNVPVVDSDVAIRSYISFDTTRCITLEDALTNSVLSFPESNFNKHFRLFKDVLKNKEKYRKFIARCRGKEWLRIRDIDNSLNSNDYFMVDRVPIYVEMFKYIKRYKVCLDRDSLLSQNICILESVNKKIKRCKKLNKIDGLLYLNL